MDRGLSIIIAAHNEAAVIQRTLRSIMDCPLDRPLQVIVVANGCTDNTAELARGAVSRVHPTSSTAVPAVEEHSSHRPDACATDGGPPTRASAALAANESVERAVEVIQTPIGNKIHALKLGDRAARYFPRAYMDADVELSPNLLQCVIDAFGEPGVCLVSPGCRHVYGGRNPLLAGYYRLWRSLPYVQRDAMARGFFAISGELRGRFGDFPNLIADDKFIRNLTRPHERRVLEHCYTTVHMPATVRDLLRVKTRWTYGNLELAQCHPELNENDQRPHDGAMRFLLPRPWLWPHLPIFLFVYWYSHREARRRLAANQAEWERADSSRRPERAV